MRQPAPAARPVVIDDAAVKPEPQRMRTVFVRAAQRLPVHARVLQVLAQVAAHVARLGAVGPPPFVARRPGAADAAPEAHGGDAETRMRLAVAQVLESLHGDQPVRLERGEAVRLPWRDGKGIAVDEDEDVVLRPRLPAGFKAEDVQLDRMFADSRLLAEGEVIILGNGPIKVRVQAKHTIVAPGMGRDMAQLPPDPEGVFPVNDAEMDHPRAFLSGDARGGPQANAEMLEVPTPNPCRRASRRCDQKPVADFRRPVLAVPSRMITFPLGDLRCSWQDLF